MNEARPVVAAMDIGAYEAAETVTPPPADVTAPTVGFLSPLDGQITQGKVRVGVASADNVGVTQLLLRVDGVQLAAVAGPTLYVVIPLAQGTHTLVATAFDKAGNQATSTIRVTRMF
jgi:hypothetical protein